MDRLKNAGVFDAKIEVIAETWQVLFPDEKTILPVTDEAFVREVWITSENKCWMFARTVIPRTFLKGKFCALQSLNTRPIGSILFHDKNIQRSDFEFRCMDPTFDLYHQIKDKQQQDSTIYARRSLFSVDNASLLLTEIFMPDMMTL